MLRLNHDSMASGPDHPHNVPSLLDPGTFDRHQCEQRVRRLLTLCERKVRSSADPGRTLTAATKTPPTFESISVILRHQGASPIIG
jgi:hypothetical protein